MRPTPRRSPAATTRRAQTLAHEHDQVTEAHAALQDELHEQAGALESTREALAAERAEAGRLRNRLAQLQQSREPGRPAAAAAGAAAGAAAAAVGDEPRARRRASIALRGLVPRDCFPAGRPDRDPAAPGRSHSRPSASTCRGSRTRPSRRHHHRGRLTARGHQTPDPPASSPSTAERLRPLNPSLRHRTWWLGRLLALLVAAALSRPCWVVLHSTDPALRPARSAGDPADGDQRRGVLAGAAAAPAAGGQLEVGDLADGLRPAARSRSAERRR